MLRKIFLLCFAFAVFLNGRSQRPDDVGARTTLDSRFAPFYHGVASGDPMSDRVILWTRVTPDQPGPQTVNWQVCTDTTMSTVVVSGTATTDDTRDYTVKVDASGLQPGTWYYYRFEQNGRYSVTGRTFTFPVGDVDSLRFGVVSCSNYPAGWFNAYGVMAQRNDMHAILHLGDYLYEGEGDSTEARGHFPYHEILNLEDYRLRHSQYKLDADLRCLHQYYPFIVVWDDHESANDAWKGGAENHTPSTEGLWEIRKRQSVQAYLEWQPIRQPDPSDTLRIYRRIDLGDLADFYMLDTRLIGRDEQTNAQFAGDPARHLLGPAQLAWLSAEMQASNAQWKIMGQQVMMAPLEVFGFPVNLDQWDGYAAERQRVYDSILTRNIDNVVVLTGDIHTAWANDLPGANYDPNSGANSIGVEFVTTSVTSGNSTVNQGQQLIQFANPHMKYINLSDHGFLVLDITKARTQGDFYYVDDIAASDYGYSREASYYVNAGERFLRVAADSAAPAPWAIAVPPPHDPPNLAIGIAKPKDPAATTAFLGAYPNPFETEIFANYYLHAPADVELSLLSISGKTLVRRKVGRQAAGIQFEGLHDLDLPAGTYLLRLRAGKYETLRKVIRY
jgi:alkaline phosphatase D